MRTSAYSIKGRSALILSTASAPKGTSLRDAVTRGAISSKPSFDLVVGEIDVLHCTGRVPVANGCDAQEGGGLRRLPATGDFLGKAIRSSAPVLHATFLSPCADVR